MPRYRVITLPSRKIWTNWRPTIAEAIEDAIKCGLADRDEYIPERIYWDPLAAVESDDGQEDTAPATSG